MQPGLGLTEDSRTIEIRMQNCSEC